MAQRKFAPKPTAAELQQLDRVRRARARMPPCDPTGEHFEAIADLARSIGADVADMFDQFEERAAAREYNANMTRADAEQLAVEDMRAMYTRQARLL